MPFDSPKYPNLLPDQPLTLLTGATGALGQELLYQLLVARPNDHFLVLARGGSKKHADGATRRVKAILRHQLQGEQLEAALQRITVLDGDLSEARLGLSPQLYEAAAERLSQVLHCAAAVRFDQPIAEAREINLEGTRRVLELTAKACRQGRETRFDYVGTAYVAGKRRKVIYETELEHKAGFHNTYEQSKYESELLVRSYRGEFPTTVYRPSIIIGNSRTGETSNFKAFYWPLRVYSMGQMKVVPGVASCRIDLVPVDYVASAVVELSQRPATFNQCYHLTAGRESLITLRQMMDAAISFFQVKPPTLIHPMLLKPIENWPLKLLLSDHSLKTLKLGEPYYPYFALNLEFDNRQAAQALASAAIAPPSPKTFFDRLFRYCVESDWGRRPPGNSPSVIPPEKIEEEIQIIGSTPRVAGAI